MTSPLCIHRIQFIRHTCQMCASNALMNEWECAFIWKYDTWFHAESNSSQTHRKSDQQWLSYDRCWYLPWPQSLSTTTTPQGFHDWLGRYLPLIMRTACGEVYVIWSQIPLSSGLLMPLAHLPCWNREGLTVAVANEQTANVFKSRHGRSQTRGCHHGRSQTRGCH